MITLPLFHSGIQTCVHQHASRFALHIVAEQEMGKQLPSRISERVNLTAIHIQYRLTEVNRGLHTIKIHVL